MKSNEFVHIRKNVLKFTQKKLGSEMEIGFRTIQRYESGDAKIPEYIAQLMRFKADEISLPPTAVATMDVSNIKSLSMHQMIDFCFKEENEQEFLNYPAMKLLLKNAKLEAKAELKQSIIFDNLNKKKG